MADSSRLAAALSDRYRLERELGQGGMATVYLAEDLKHNRKVAIKVLKPELAAVLGAERFVQEIATTAALQHPNILPLFDSGSADGFLYYVMPYVEGETLRDRLNRETQLGVDESVALVREVADALQYAHEHGVVHRDIKPENILLHASRPMVADFGIALAVSAAAGGRMTETGLSLGTPHYMSPEQATADKTITARSDIYSLASVLYEMLTGEPPHMGNSAQQIIMKIIADVPRPVTELRKAVPANVAAAVGKALEKLPADRFESARAFAEALANASYATVASATGAATLAARATFRRTVVGLVALSVIATAAALWGWFRPRAGDTTPPMWTQLALAPGESFFVRPFDRDVNGDRPSRTAFTFSPDGQSLVYVGDSSRLMLRSLDAGTSTPIQGIRGESPFFSPNGQSIAYWADGYLRRVSLAGGPPTDLLAVDRIAGGSWSADGHIVVGSQTAGLILLSANGGAPPDTIARSGAILPHFLPGGKALLFTYTNETGELSDYRIEWLSLETAERKVLIENAADGRFVPSTGHLIFARQGTVLGVRFDPRHPQVTSAPFTVLPDVMQALNAGNSGARTAALQLAISPKGQLAWLTGGITPDVRGELSWLDRAGRRTAIPAANGPGLGGVRLSPDGTRAAILLDGSTPGIKIVDLARHTSQMIGTGIFPGWPLWSSDGRRIVALGRLQDSVSLVWLEADGSRPPEPVIHAKAIVAEAAFWSPDSSEIVAYPMSQAPGGDSLMIAISLKNGTVRAIANLSVEIRWPTLSPDGKWLAYSLLQSGSAALYLQPWPALDRRWKVADSATSPVWTRKGQELVYNKPTGRVDSTGQPRRAMMAVEIRSGSDPDPSAPHELFAAAMNHSTPLRSHDVSADGSRFYVITRTPVMSPPGPLNVIVNWFEELRRLAAQQGKP